MTSSLRARWDAVLRFESTDAVGEGTRSLCRGRTGVVGSGRLRVLAVLGARLRGLGIEGPVVLSFMERRTESEGAESEGVPLCVFVGRGAIVGPGG